MTRTNPSLRLYDEDAEHLMLSDQASERVTLLPMGESRVERPEDVGERIRILWGQEMLRDLLDGRYRTMICGVNDQDNSRGIVSQLCDLVSASQWTAASVTSYARMFQGSVATVAGGDKEPYILKFDLDSLLILGILRPRGRDHFTLHDLSRGFKTIAKMLRDRRERSPVASVSFLNARANRLEGADAKEPSFESVLRTMFDAGFRGDVFAPPAMWRYGHIGVYPSYPFPEGLERMRGGSS
ncbi:MAG: hypothetical protein AB7Q00_01960 [Phycisphaerales bacterium]|nr:MAG: hypothetical protein IPK69_06580 [Phycisphaerales bacterium]